MVLHPAPMKGASVQQRTIGVANLTICHHFSTVSQSSDNADSDKIIIGCGTNLTKNCPCFGLAIGRTRAILGDELTKIQPRELFIELF